MNHMEHDETRESVQTYDVYNSPEFRAFCERFGIAWGLPSRDMVIRLPFEGLMTVEHEYICTQPKPDVPFGVAIDTTTQQNKKYRTKEPSRRGAEEG